MFWILPLGHGLVLERNWPSPLHIKTRLNLLENSSHAMLQSMYDAVMVLLWDWMYKTIKTEHEAGTLTKRKFFKALMTYQFREAFSLKNVVKSGVKTSSKNIGEGVKELAFGDLQKQIRTMIDEAIQRGIYTLLGAQARDAYEKVNKALDQISSWMEKVTGAVEFCLSDVYPPERPALYHAYFTVTKSA